jgi:TfoX/Sxy family transcriptional regulator of competence genes
MRIPKADPRTVELFGELMPRTEDVVAKKLFGQPAAFVHGNLFFGVYGRSLFVRLSEVDRREAAAAGFSFFEPMPGRAMREYLVLPAEVMARPARARHWVDRAIAYASSLPAKSPKRK